MYRRLARRGGLVGGAYLATSAITLAVLYVFARLGDAAMLRSVIAAHFVATLAGGLEPATTKALALSGRVALTAEERRTVLIASALKAFAVSPVFILVWRLTDRGASWPLLACAPLVCVAGFLATDLRVLLDLEGRHASAIWLKQGSLGGGFAIFAVAAAEGAPLALAVAAASLARIAFAIGAARLMPAPSIDASRTSLASILRDPKWMSLAGASVVAAIGGSADRIFGLHYLASGAAAGYFALYEVFSKFWIIPYIAAPVVFVRLAGGREGASVGGLAWRLAAGAGALLVAVVGLALVAAPDLPSRVLGARLGGGLPAGAIAAFVAGVALSGLAQIRVAQIQGGGGAHRGFIVVAIGAAAAMIIFYGAARWLGAVGLLYGWLAKSAIDLALTYAPAPRRRR